MMLPDVNIIVQAFRGDTMFHGLCREWLKGMVNGEAHFGMSPQVLSSVVRITTHPKVFVQPSNLQEVLHFCSVLIDQSHCVIVHPHSGHWEIFQRLCIMADARGNLVPDAWFAALAIESGCEWVTLDRDYARFPGLNWRVLAG